MRGRGRGNGGGPPADLLVCFPARAHLTLMPKPICSPSRPTEPPKRRYSRPTNLSQSSPLFKTKSKKNTSDSDISEPTSPKVTCAGQIKVRHRSRPKNWFTVMEEMEKLHKQRKKPSWSQPLGLLSFFKHFHFSMNCFGSLLGSVICTSDDEEDEQEEGEGGEGEKKKEMESDASGAIFSKWFSVLEENPGDAFKKEVVGRGEGESSSVPPPNALLLMRCRSAPAKGWLEGEGGFGRKDLGGGGAGELSRKKMKDDEEKEEKRFVLMSYAPDYYEVSSDVVKETWLVGSLDPMARSLSWKR